MTGQPQVPPHVGRQANVDQRVNFGMAMAVTARSRYQQVSVTGLGAVAGGRARLQTCCATLVTVRLQQGCVAA